MVRDLGAAPTVNGVLQRAAASDWRAVRLPDGRQVGPREVRWREWLRTASLLDRLLAWEALPEPERQRETLVQPSRPVAPLPVSARLEDPWDDYHRVPATPEEFRIVAEALQHVQQLGLRVPPVRIEFTDEDLQPPGTQGQTFDRQRPVVVLLRTGLGVVDLFRITCHELQHASDAGLDLTRDEGEQRAHAFAAWATAQAGFSS